MHVSCEFFFSSCVKRNQGLPPVSLPLLSSIQCGKESYKFHIVPQQKVNQLLCVRIGVLPNHARGTICMKDMDRNDLPVRLTSTPSCCFHARLGNIFLFACCKTLLILYIIYKILLLYLGKETVNLRLTSIALYKTDVKIGPPKIWQK